MALGGYAYYANRAGSGRPSLRPTRVRRSRGSLSASGGFAIGVEPIKVAAVGSLKPTELMILRPEIAGRIAAIHFRDGVPVEQGAVLVSLGTATQCAELRQAQANLVLACTNYWRTEELFEKKCISEQTQDKVAASLQVLEAAVALAEARYYQKTQVRAPFADIVGIRSVSVGDYMQDLINLGGRERPEGGFLPVGSQSSPATAGTVGGGDHRDAMPSSSFTGTVNAIDPQLDAAGRVVSVRARLDNHGAVAPGDIHARAPRPRWRAPRAGRARAGLGAPLASSSCATGYRCAPRAGCGPWWPPGPVRSHEAAGSLHPPARLRHGLELGDAVVLAAGAGMGSRQQIGWMIVSRLLLGTLLTLVVVLTVYIYSLLSRGRAHRPQVVPEAA